MNNARCISQLASAPAVFRTSASRTPVHSAQPAPPLLHWLPRAGGENAPRPLPPHSSTMRRVTALYFDFNSPSVISSLLFTSPSMVIFHLSGSLVSSGVCPLLRMKNFSVGVVSSSSRLSGVSATSGLSPRTTSLSFLPGNFRYCGPFGAAGAAGGDAGAAPCACALGMPPVPDNGMTFPMIAPKAAKAVPPKNLRLLASTPRSTRAALFSAMIVLPCCPTFGRFSAAGFAILPGSSICGLQPCRKTSARWHFVYQFNPSRSAMTDPSPIRPSSRRRASDYRSRAGAAGTDRRSPRCRRRNSR